MHKSCLGAVVIDCRTSDLTAAAAFWSAALGYPANPAGDGRYVNLQGPAGQPALIVQQVGHPSRVHLDIETDDIDAEVARLEKLGAKRVSQVESWWVMEAPTGQRFCVIRPQREDFAERGLVRQV